MNRAELEKILAEQEEKDALLERLFEAVISNNLEAVKSICEKNKPIAKNVINGIKLINKKSKTLLECAADSEIAEYLIEQGADLSIAVTQAVQRNDLEAVKSICEKNKSIIKRELQKDVRILTAIACRGFDNDVNDIIKYLIEQGANLNAADNCGRYLLHLQIAKGNLKGAQTFIENGADVNIVNQEEQGYWMSGIDPNALKGQTALSFAIRTYANNRVLNPEKAEEALEFINFLIEKKANVDAQDFRGRTVLDTAMFFDASKIVELLIKAGADLNIGDKTAEDILRYAITKGHTGIGKSCIRYILEHDSCWLTRSDRPDLLNGQEELSNYWNEYRTQVTKLHDIVGDRIDLIDDGSTRPIMRTLSEFLDHDSRKSLVKALLMSVPDGTNDASGNRDRISEEGPCPRKLAVISVAVISCALALYFLAPLIIGSTAGVGTQLALGFAGAVAGGGIGYLTNIVIDKFCGNEVAEQIV